MIKIMLDTNVYGRSFDDLADKNVESEAVSSKKIFSFAHLKIISIFTSEILFYEINLISNKTKREVVFHLAKDVEKSMISINPDIEKLADDLQIYLKDYADCLHVSSAALTDCSYFATCDKELLKKAGKIESFLLKLNIKLHVVNPIELVSVLGERYGN